MLSKQKMMTCFAVISLAAIITTGTYAWTSLNSQKINVWTGSADPGTGPGGTLHDDHADNDKNKDIYVENWGDEDLYVRIQLTEYFEVGEGAGLKSVSTNNETGEPIPNPLNLAEPVGGIKVIDKVDEWRSIFTRFMPAGGIQPDLLLQNWWKWDMGGSKYYYPAPSSSRKQKDYVDQNSPEGLMENSVSIDGIFAQLTHSSEVLLLQDWIKAGSPIGDYWVIDIMASYMHIWAYWAAPLHPGEATGLLIDRVTMLEPPIGGAIVETFDPNKGYYYGINVLAQMATKDGETDNNGFIDSYKSFGIEENGGWSKESQDLMEKIVSGNDNVIYPYSTYDLYLESGRTRFRFNIPMLNGVLYAKKSPSNIWADGLSLNGKVAYDPDYIDADKYSIIGTVNESIVLEFKPSLQIGDKFDFVFNYYITDYEGDPKPDPDKPLTTISIPVIIVPQETKYVVLGKSGKVYIDYGDYTYRELHDDGSLGLTIGIDGII
jgi:hypothetical protein